MSWGRGWSVIRGGKKRGDGVRKWRVEKKKGRERGRNRIELGEWK